MPAVTRLIPRRKVLYGLVKFVKQTNKNIHTHTYMHARTYIYVTGCWLGGVVPDFHFTENVMTGASYRQKWSCVVFVV